MKKDVVFVTGSMRRGGAERVISILANELVNRGWRVHIITLLYSAVGYDLNNNIEIIDISNEKRNQLIDTPRLILTLRRLIKSIDPGVTVSFMLTINIVTWIASRGLSTRYIPSERNDPAVGRSKVIHVLSCFAYSTAYRTVFQTERARSFYSNRIQRKGVIIANPVIVSGDRKDSMQHKIVSVGRLEKQKNQELLIEAFSKVINEHPEYSLHIYGEGSQRKHIEELISKLNIESNVYLHGNVKDVHNQIADAEFFVLTSNYEGLSNALLEAVTIGIPCISTDCAGTDQAIIDGKNGFIVPIGDITSLIDAMNKMINDSEMRAAFEINSKEISKKFSVDSIVSQWELLFS